MIQLRGAVNGKETGMGHTDTMWDHQGQRQEFLSGV